MTNELEVLILSIFKAVLLYFNAKPVIPPAVPPVTPKE